ncbi:MAG: DUF2730 family protein [Paracoccaceae bacterium]
MEKLVVAALEAALANSELTALGVITMVLLLGYILRSKAWLGREGKVVSTTALATLTEKVSNIDTRVAVVENQIEELPTRQEMHDTEVALTRIDGRLDGMEQLQAASGRQLTRIEDFMIDASRRRPK